MNASLRLPFALVMLFYQSMALAFSQIWANKFRGLLTVLGILIGVAAVCAIVTLMEGTRRWLLREFEAFGAKKITILPHFPAGRRTTLTTYWQTIFRGGDFDQMLEHCPSVDTFTRCDEFGGDVLNFGSRTEDENVSVYGVDPRWHDIEHRSVIAGRTLSYMDNLNRRPVCIINKVVRDKLGMDQNPVGQYLTVDGARLLVIGLLEAAPVSLANDAEHREVLVPFRYLLAKDAWPSYAVFATSKTAELSEDAKAEIEFYMRQKRRIKPGKEDTFEVRNDQRVVDQFNRVASMVTLIATGVVGISLLVGGVGIMNIMLVSVSERTREIGLRKSVGAPPAAILMQFLVEAIVLCLFGGALGLAGGQALTSGVTSLLPTEIRLDRMWVTPLAVVLAFAFSSGVGLIFGFFPAVKAARLDPIEALRHE